MQLLYFLNKISMQNYINNYIRINNNKAWLSGRLIFTQDNTEFSAFSKSLYRHTKTNYLKFFKMDRLCKLGFISAEILISENNLPENYEAEEIAVVLSNSNSTIDTDTNYYNTIKDKDNYFPSPGLFVYTLPNIVSGEISIKNKFKGENNFFISKEFDPEISTIKSPQESAYVSITEEFAGVIEFRQMEEVEEVMGLVQGGLRMCTL